MKLNVPLVRQDKNSQECGLAGLAMIFKYYNVPISYEKLKIELKADKTGTYMPQLGSYLIQNGFEVEIISLHPKLFSLKDKNKKSVLNYFTSLYKKIKLKQNKKVMSYFIKFLKDGGKIKVKIADKQDIITEIKNKRPICALLTSNFLYRKKPGFNFHFNLVTGIDNKYVYVNDPLWNNNGGKKRYKISDFFYGVYASCYGDLDNASLMKIKKVRL